MPTKPVPKPKVDPIELLNLAKALKQINWGNEQQKQLADEMVLKILSKINEAL